MADYIPDGEANQLQWMQHFSEGITNSPSTFQLSSSDATTISTAVEAFASALSIATNPATRTKVSVAEKDEARNDSLAVCRQYAQQIKLNAGVSDPDKLSIGVPTVNETRQPRNVPDSSPLLNVIGATPGAQTVRYADSSTPDSGAKPFGATQLFLFVAIKDAATTNEDDGKFYGAFSRNPVAVAFDPADDGKVATYFARWADNKGQVGPWSLPVSMRIAA